MQVIARRATSSDAAKATELYVRARHAGSAAGTIPPLVHDDNKTRDSLTHLVIPKLECWLAARLSGTLVGLLVLDADWIDQLYVDPALTRNGIGAELIAVAKCERPDGLRLWTFVSNQGAQRFYLRHEFQEVERTDRSRNEEGLQTSNMRGTRHNRPGWTSHDTLHWLRTRGAKLRRSPMTLPNRRRSTTLLPQGEQQSGGRLLPTASVHFWQADVLLQFRATRRHAHHRSRCPKDDG
jgi:GNAT superfamily N-acetyltransferase